MKENVECISSVATRAQVKEFSGGDIDPDGFPCCRAVGSIIMVIRTKKVNVALEDMTDNDWTTGTYQDILAKYNASNIKDFPIVHAVDLLSIATQSNPIPMKDVPVNFTEALPGIYHGGSSLVETLQKDTFKFKIEGKKDIRTSRWMMLNVNQEFRSTKHDAEMQHHMRHGEATVKCGSRSIIPSIQHEDTPILAIRTYTAPYTAVVNLAYYYHYGAHRCNILQDSELGSSVYCYPDVKTALNSIDVSKSGDRQICLAIVSGYLCKVQKKKERISLNPRSCKLLKIFAPLCTKIEVPQEMGVEDILAFR